MNKTIKTIFVIAAFLILAIALAGMYKFNYLSGQDGYDMDGNTTEEVQNNDSQENTETPMTGNDRDEHGCIGSAGYSWSEEKQECVRSWEENTETTSQGNVEIVLTDKLDGILSEYCIDIAGGNQNVDTDNGLQAHTCYSYKGDLGTDQIFDNSKFVDNVLYMPVYDVCAHLSSLESGTSVELTDCENATAITFSGNGQISPVDAPNLCFTAAEDSRMGKGSQHQIRNLTLETCETDSVYQTWSTRSID